MHTNGTMNSAQICRVCLVTGVKMFNIKKTRPYRLLGSRSNTTLANAFYRMTGQRGVNLQNEFLCFECAALLKKYDEFKYKCSEAQKVLGNNLLDKEKIAVIRNKELYSSSKLMLSLNITVTSIAPSNTEELSSDFIKTEFLEEVKEEAEESENYIDQDNNEVEYKDVVKSDTENHDETSETYIIVKKKKRRKSTKPEETDSSFDDTDSEPLSKIRKDKNEPQLQKKKGPKFDDSCFKDYTTIISLTPDDARKEVEMRKESNNYKNCPFKCELCYRGFEAQKAYDNHMKKHSSEFGDKECEFCHLRFMSGYKLTKHLFSCHKRKYCCDICPYICFFKTQAKVHMNLHKGMKYNCDLCDESFSMPNTRYMHMRIKHAAECVCALCGSTFVTQKGLTSHNLLLHRQETNEKKGPTCEECDVHFSSEKAWKRHLVLSAKHQVSHGCEACGETFLDEQSLKTHMRVHARKQTGRQIRVTMPGACPICSEWLNSRAEYKEHTKAQHPDSHAARLILADELMPCVCEMCGKRFKKPCFLAHHQRQHNKLAGGLTRRAADARPTCRAPRRLAPDVPQVCRLCQAVLGSASALRKHVKEGNEGMHPPLQRGLLSWLAPDVPQMFRLCQAVLGSASALRKHVKGRHLNLRPHKCAACGKAFPTKCEVKYHVRHVHCKVPWPKRDRGKAKQAAA